MRSCVKNCGFTNLVSKVTVNLAPAEQSYACDMSEVRGQPLARRALELAAAGGHNLLMLVPPGTEKSMLAQRLPTILPEMTVSESLQMTKIYSIARLLPEGVPTMLARPFRAPHHTTSKIGMTGGTRNPRPGELSLAHNGVIFLDELPEYPRDTLEALRQPLENGTITITRAAGSVTFPCEMLLVCAMNPCPCGNFGNPKKNCTCSPAQIHRYLSRILGPLLDRIDIHVEMTPVEFSDLSGEKREENSETIRKRVAAARERQRERCEALGVSCNARLPAGKTRAVCRLSPDAEKLLKKSFDELALSARAYDKVLRVARTAADLADEEIIGAEFVAEALRFRLLNRKYWGKASSDCARREK